MFDPALVCPCPGCGEKRVRLAIVTLAGQRDDLAAECRSCGLRAPRARSVDLESMSEFFEPGTDHPDDVEIARRAWNRLSSNHSLGRTALGAVLS